MRVISLPKAKGSILFRLENIHDQKTANLNLTQYCIDMYQHVNGADALPSLTFTELSLSANQLYSEVVANRFKWQTVDDVPHSSPSAPTPFNPSKIMLDALHLKVV